MVFGKNCPKKHAKDLNLGIAQESIFHIIQLLPYVMETSTSLIFSAGLYDRLNLSKKAIITTLKR